VGEKKKAGRTAEKVFPEGKGHSIRERFCRIMGGAKRNHAGLPSSYGGNLLNWSLAEGAHQRKKRKSHSIKMGGGNPRRLEVKTWRSESNSQGQMGKFLTIRSR